MKKTILLSLLMICCAAASAQYVGANRVQAHRLVSGSENYWFARTALVAGYDMADVQGLVQLSAGKFVSSRIELSAVAMTNVLDKGTTMLLGAVRGYTNFRDLNSRFWLELAAGGKVYDSQSHNLGYLARLGIGFALGHWEAGLYGGYTGDIWAGFGFGYTFPIL